MIFESLNDAATRGELLLVDGGLCHFHRRRNGQVTIREIIVQVGSRHKGIGWQLVRDASQGASRVVAKCPDDLPSNGFWQRIGFVLESVETTKTGRIINVWVRECA